MAALLFLKSKFKSKISKHEETEIQKNHIVSRSVRKVKEARRYGHKNFAIAARNFDFLLLNFYFTLANECSSQPYQDSEEISPVKSSLTSSGIN